MASRGLKGQYPHFLVATSDHFHLLQWNEFLYKKDGLGKVVLYKAPSPWQRMRMRREKERKANGKQLQRAKPGRGGSVRSNSF